MKKAILSQDEYRDGLLKKGQKIRLAMKVFTILALGGIAGTVGALAFGEDSVASASLLTSVFAFVGQWKAGNKQEEIDKRFHATELDYDSQAYPAHPTKQFIAEEVAKYDRNEDLFV